MRPMITVPLKNITTEEHKTVHFTCGVTATTRPDWTQFRWLRNGNPLTTNKKYNITTIVNPYKSNKNFRKSVLTIHDISKEDEAVYTCIVYYDRSVLNKFGINDEFSYQANASLKVVNSSEGLYICQCVYHLCNYLSCVHLQDMIHKDMDF